MTDIGKHFVNQPVGLLFCFFSFLFLSPPPQFWSIGNHNNFMLILFIFCLFVCYLICISSVMTCILHVHRFREKTAIWLRQVLLSPCWNKINEIKWKDKCNFIKSKSKWASTIKESSKVFVSFPFTLFPYKTSLTNSGQTPWLWLCMQYYTSQGIHGASSTHGATTTLHALSM